MKSLPLYLSSKLPGQPGHEETLVILTTPRELSNKEMKSMMSSEPDRVGEAELANLPGRVGEAEMRASG